MQPERRVINGIRVLLCGRADWAWDPTLQDFVSTNCTYVDEGKRDPRDIRWERRDDYRFEDETKGHQAWLKGEE